MIVCYLLLILQPLFGTIFSNPQAKGRELNNIEKETLIDMIQVCAPDAVGSIIPPHRAPYNLNFVHEGEYPLIHAIHRYLSYDDCSMDPIILLVERGTLLSGQLSDDVWSLMQRLWETKPSRKAKEVLIYLLENGLVPQQ